MSHPDTCCACGIPVHSAENRRVRRCDICLPLGKHPPVHKRSNIRTLIHAWCSRTSEHTARSRFVDLRHFFGFVLGEPTPPPSTPANERAAALVLKLLNTSSAHAERVVLLYIETQAGLYADSTIARRIKTLRSWARYLHGKQASLCDLGDVPCIPATKRGDAAPAPPHEEVDAQRLSPAAKTRAQQFIAARNKTIATVLAHSPLNRSGLLYLDWKAVDFSESTTSDDGTTTPTHVLARVQVPGRDGRLLWRHLGHQATRALKHWSRVYTRRFGATLPDRPIIAALSGERLSKTHFYELADLDRAH